MKTLNVFFEEHDVNYSDGTAVLYENFITNEIKLVLNNHLFLDEIQTFINKAVDILKPRYDDINVNIHWDTATKGDVK